MSGVFLERKGRKCVARMECHCVDTVHRWMIRIWMISDMSFDVMEGGVGGGRGDGWVGCAMGQFVGVTDVVALFYGEGDADYAAE